MCERNSRDDIPGMKLGRTKLLSVAFCAIVVIFTMALAGACTSNSETADVGSAGQIVTSAQVGATKPADAQDGGVGYSAAEIAGVVAATQDGQTGLYLLAQDESDFSYRVENGYLLDPSLISDGVICYADGFYADEICVLRVDDPADIKTVTDALSKYKTGRADTYAGYAPDQSAIAASGIVVTSGSYAALLICSDDSEKAKTAFLSCFSEPLPTLPSVSPFLPTLASTTTTSATATTTTSTTTASAQTTTSASSVAPSITSTSVTTTATATTTTATTTTAATTTTVQPTSTTTAPTAAATTAATTTAAPPPTTTATVPPTSEQIPDIYDHNAVLNAWRTGDVSGLGQKNLAILSACDDVIGKVITEGMSDYDKELAIHDYIIEWSDYDWATESPDPNAVIEPDHDNPYGMLIGKKGICSGYSSTFQLFMDMLGIECVTVYGTANRARDEHAWNQVRLDDGEWYCVDVTWDDPFGQIFYNGAAYHRFLNVTSGHMRDTYHFWDESAIPECTATKYGYNGE